MPGPHTAIHFHRVPIQSSHLLPEQDIVSLGGRGGRESQSNSQPRSPVEMLSFVESVGGAP